MVLATACAVVVCIGQVTEADDVAGEGELDDLVMAVVPTHVMAKRAALDAVKLIARIACVEIASRPGPAGARVQSRAHG